MSVAKTLAEEGCEVMAIDKNEERVQQISEFVTHAITADATDEKMLRTLGVQQIDVAIICIGQDIQASILIALLLKELGVKEILAKAVNPSHGKVLEKIGVNKVVFPEIEMGQKVARSMVSKTVREQVTLCSEYSLMEIVAPPNFVGKTLRQLNIRGKFGVNVVAIKRQMSRINDKGAVSSKDYIDIAPDAEDRIAKNDVLLVFGKTKDIQALLAE
jgi:trk system potassium uptake protein TrkA